MIKIILLGLMLSPMSLYGYPLIKSWKKNPTIAFDGKKTATLKKNEMLKSEFAVITANSEELNIQLNEISDLLIYEKTKIQVPYVFEDAETSHEIYLLDGQIRLKTKKIGAKQKKTQLKTVFFELFQPANSDVIVHVDMKVPSIEIKMIKGEWPLEFFSYEKKITLKAGQKVLFKGELSDSDKGIKYDYLLEGRKIPAGQLQKVEKFEISEFYEQEKAAEKAALNKKKIEEQKVAEKIRKQKEYEDSFLCKKPFGQKDQCAWWIEKEACFRKRCNVNGEWGDVIERPFSDKCPKQDFFVGECDY